MVLSEIRQKISSIDSKLLELFDERMALALKVADYKSAHNLPIVDEMREQEILEKIPDEYRELWDTLMDISKRRQFEFLPLLGGVYTPEYSSQSFPRGKKSEFYQRRNTKIAIQWGKWSFNEIAIRHFLDSEASVYPTFQSSHPEIIYAYTTEEVLKQISRGEVEYGQFAIANSIGGLVHETLESLGSKKWKYVTHYAIPVKHCLMIHKEAKLEYITTIMGHEQAICQCKQTLDRLYTDREKKGWISNLTDNASIAEAVSDGTLPKSVASIGHESLAEIYGLKIIERDIQDRDDNMTTFVLVEKR